MNTENPCHTRVGIIAAIVPPIPEAARLPANNVSNTSPA